MKRSKKNEDAQTLKEKEAKANNRAEKYRERDRLWKQQQRSKMSPAEIAKLNEKRRERMWAETDEERAERLQDQKRRHKRHVAKLKANQQLLENANKLVVLNNNEEIKKLNYGNANRKSVIVPNSQFQQNNLIQLRENIREHTNSSQWPTQKNPHSTAIMLVASNDELIGTTSNEAINQDIINNAQSFDICSNNLSTETSLLETWNIISQIMLQ